MRYRNVLETIKVLILFVMLLIMADYETHLARIWMALS